MSGDDDDGPPADVIPTGFVSTRPKRDLDAPDELRSFRFDAYKGRTVEIMSSGFRYTGTLVGADEGDVYLKTELRWLVLPLDRVTALRVVDEKRRPMGGIPEPEK